MALGGRWHKRDDIEVIPVFVPTLIVDKWDEGCNDFALPGEYIVLEGMSARRAPFHEIQARYVCDEAPELSVADLKDLL